MRLRIVHIRNAIPLYQTGFASLGFLELNVLIANDEDDLYNVREDETVLDSRLAQYNSLVLTARAIRIRVCNFIQYVTQ